VPRTHTARTTSITRRRLAGLAVALLSAAAFAAPAQAAPGIGTHGPLTERYGFFPEYYEDGAGLRLQLCIDLSAACGAVLTPHPGPISFPGNFPDELFYSRATATAAGVDLALAQEATFGGTDGTQAVFGRVRVIDKGGLLDPQAWYRFTTPYGQFDAQGAKRPLDATVPDVGCGPLIGQPCAASPADTFAASGGSEVGPNFLTWPDYANDPKLPSGYVGDSVTPHAVTGAAYVPADATINPVNACPVPPDPLADPPCEPPANVAPLDLAAANYFRIDRISANGGTVVSHVAQTAQFVVTGKLADDPARPYLLAQPGAAGSQPIADGPKSFSLKVRNGGSADLKIGTVSIAGNSDFAVASTDCTDDTVIPAGRSQNPGGPAQTCTVSLTLDPSSAGAKSATLRIAEQAGGPVHEIALTGSGTQPLLGTDQDGLSFGVQPVGTTAATMTAVVRNTGNAPLRLTDAALSGVQAGDFAIIANACNGATLAPNATCAIDVQFTPTATGVRTASLDIRSAAGAKSLALSGIGSAAAPGPGVTIVQQGTPGPTGAVGNSGAVTTAGRPKLTLTRLGTAKKIKAATARRHGIRLRMELPAGAEVLKLNVYRRGGGKLTLISSTSKTPGTTGAYTVRLSQLALRRALRRGIYEVHATPGRSKTDLGTTSKFAFTVT
jgi:hypothetical protein